MTNDEIVGLLDKARDSIGAAHLLHEGDYYSVAVSRAYYAMFYCAKALLLKQGQSFSKHSAVIAAFGKEFAKTRQLDPQLHRHLLDAFRLRQSADYDQFVEISAEQTEEQIRRAREFLAAAANYLSKDTQK